MKLRAYFVLSQELKTALKNSEYEFKEKHNNSTYYWIFCLLVGLQHPATKTTTVSEIKAFFLIH